jgi:AbiJ N-terminal domain 4
MRFSERQGHRKVRDRLQLDSVDEPLKNGLWNVLQASVWATARTSGGMYPGPWLSHDSNPELKRLCDALWFTFFKLPLDQLDHSWTKVRAELRKFFFSCTWFEVYDFIEFVADHYQNARNPKFKESFTAACNFILEREASGYRFVGGQIAPIVEPEQVEEIDQALAHGREPVRAHLRRALDLLSDRSSPDYRNSIKESISAVEGLVVAAVGEKGTLGQLIKRLEERAPIHPALRNGLSSLYGYTSDEGGIRHALMEADSVTFAEAKFLLVVCSAFVNLVEGKMNGLEGR